MIVVANVRAKPMSTGLIQTVIADYYAATREMNVDAWLATMSEDIVSYQPVGTPPLKGREAHRQFFLNFSKPFKVLGLIEEFVHIVDNQVAVKWTGFGTGKNGREIMFEGIDLIEMDVVGLVETVWAYWDPAAIIAEVED